MRQIEDIQVVLAQRVKVCQFSNNWRTLAHYIHDRTVEPSKNN